jgi:hypothetical protein
MLCQKAWSKLSHFEPKMGQLAADLMARRIELAPGSGLPVGVLPGCPTTARIWRVVAVEGRGAEGRGGEPPEHAINHGKPF